MHAVQIMAIVNTSPDSFSGDGLHIEDTPAIRRRIRACIDQGADMLDIGGQSTRPGAEIIDTEEELARVIPAIKMASDMTELPISVDTFKPAVARAALEAGATIINDIHGATDPDMIKLVAESGCKVVVMHSRGTPQTMSKQTDYPKGVVDEVRDYLQERAKALQDAGVAKDRIILDPGIGFAKTAPQSFELSRQLDKLVTLGYPVLYGSSQKSFIGKALAEDGEIAPLHERTVGNAVLQGYAMIQGAAIVRVHDVPSAIQTRTIVEALLAQKDIPA